MLIWIRERVRDFEICRQFLNVDADLNFKFQGHDLAFVGGFRKTREDDEEALFGVHQHDLYGVFGDNRVVDIQKGFFQSCENKAETE